MTYRRIFAVLLAAAAVGPLSAEPTAVDATGQPLKNAIINQKKSRWDVEVTDLSTGQIFHTSESVPGRPMETPFLNDWTTSHSNILIYKGRITGLAGETTPTKIEVSVVPIPDGVAQVMVTHFQATTSAQGEFQFAYDISPGRLGYQISVRINEPNLAPDEFKLTPVKIVEFSPRHALPQVQVVLQLANGETIDPARYPVEKKIQSDILDGVWNEGVGRLEEMPLSENSLSRPLRIYQVDGKNKFVAERVPTSSTFTVKAFNRLFGERYISANDTLVTFTEMTRPFSIRSRVVAVDGQPVANAMVAIHAGGQPVEMSMLARDHKAMQDLLQSSKSAPDYPGLVMARTDASGNFVASGFNMSNHAGVYVSAPGFEPVHYYRYFDMATTGALETEAPLTGDAETTPLAVLRTAYVRFHFKPFQGRDVEVRRPVTHMVGGDPTTGPMILSSMYSLLPMARDTTHTTATFAYQYWPNVIQEGKDAVISVPAEVAFELAWDSKWGRMVVPVNVPLAPGETRDLGELEYEPKR